jgi:hypothetical protein
VAVIDYPFTEAEAEAAHEEWGCNCGPTALAFALQKPLATIRHAIPNFAERRYTSPSMMRAALENLGQRFIAIKPDRRDAGVPRMFAGPMTLVRIQWTGPWIVDGKPQRWAARQTHWIACWSDAHDVWAGGRYLVFDCNGGMRTFGSWDSEIVPLIVASVKRADGGWYPANIWRLIPGKDATTHEL